MKKLIATVLTMMVLTLGLTACGSDGNLVGTWYVTLDSGSEHQYIFNEDGTMKVGGSLVMMNGTYKINGDTIECEIQTPATGVKKQSIPYKLDGDKLELTLTNNKYTYTRK